MRSPNTYDKCPVNVILVQMVNDDPHKINMEIHRKASSWNLAFPRDQNKPVKMRCLMRVFRIGCHKLDTEESEIQIVCVMQFIN